MASPQLENGYVKISNEIWDALLKYNINGESRRILDFIIRKTYGFNKKWDIVSLSQFSKATGINRRNVQRCIKKLIQKKMVAVKQTLDGNISYCFNKDFDRWLRGGQIDALASKRVKGSVKMGKKVASKQTHTKDILQKTITKDKKIYSLFEKDIINFLNEKTGKNFKYSNKTKSLINARKKEGWSFEDFQYVIEIKCGEWMNDPEMNIYLRPLTLFGTKFESYRNQKAVIKQKTFLEMCAEDERKNHGTIETRI